MKPSETYYDEIVLNFPAVWPEDHEWINVHDGQAIKENIITDLIARYIDEPEALVIVHLEPGIGAKLQTEDVLTFISPYILDSEIQVSNPQYNSFLAILKIGVATGWRTSTNDRNG